RIDPGRTALVVIDMISFFVEESGHCLGIVPNIANLAEEVRGTGGTVAWARPAPDHRYPALMTELFGDEVAELYRTMHGKREIWPAFQIDAADISIEKSLFSAFFPGSSLLPSLLQRPRYRHCADHRNGDQHLL